MRQPLKITSPIKLKDFDPGFHAGLDKDKTQKATAKLHARIGELQHLLYANATDAVLIVFQGMDTSGKDGSTKNLLDAVNPAGVQVANFKTPSAEERAHDFLWRVHGVVPRHGNLGVFNRSHYEDVLIVRVLELQPKKIWRARYEQINAFEKMLAQNQIVLLKFFLHISKEEQAGRLQARLDDPARNWKFETGDLKMRALWNGFQKAYEDAINFCSPRGAPWHIVPADRKWYRDFVVAQTVAGALENLKLKWPRSREDLSRVKVI
jgi:PPK2 family polyphosphate:nucleotide phosphotransferase